MHEDMKYNNRVDHISMQCFEDHEYWHSDNNMGHSDKISCKENNPFVHTNLDKFCSFYFRKSKQKAFMAFYGYSKWLTVMCVYCLYSPLFLAPWHLSQVLTKVSPHPRSGTGSLLLEQESQKPWPHARQWCFCSLPSNNLSQFVQCWKIRSIINKNQK